jgi:hypothetical protein
MQNPSLLYWPYISNQKERVKRHHFNDVPVMPYIFLKGSLDIHPNLISLENDQDKGLAQ